MSLLKNRRRVLAIPSRVLQTDGWEPQLAALWACKAERSEREQLDAATLCRQLVSKGSVEAFLADHRHPAVPRTKRSPTSSRRAGRPSIPADVIATVVVLQFLEGLSDREAARAVRNRVS